jgi:hypothetical protein
MPSSHNSGEEGSMDLIMWGVILLVGISGFVGISCLIAFGMYEDEENADKDR